jgi:hypothetical protein
MRNATQTEQVIAVRAAERAEAIMAVKMFAHANVLLLQLTNTHVSFAGPLMNPIRPFKL